MRWHGRKYQPPVILAKAGIHFSPHTPGFEGVEKGLSPRLFVLSAILRKRESTARWIPAFARMTAGGDSTFATKRGRRKEDTQFSQSRNLWVSYSSLEIYGCPILPYSSFILPSQRRQTTANEWQFISTVYSFATF